MRAEDLFEAVGGMDEKLIARSDRAGSSTQRKTSVKKAGNPAERSDRKSRRSMGAEIYRFAVIAMATAVAVFAVLMAGDILGIRSLSDLRNLRVTRGGSEIVQDSAQTEEAAQAQEGAGQEAVSKIEADPALESGTQSEANSRQAPKKEETTEEGAEKAAVELLGDLKGDYVSIEYISAEDEASGKSRTVPEYSEEGEKALAEAFTKGEASPKFLADTGEATYYVYLTKKNGEVHKVTFYENCYVSMDNVPGVVMKITEAEYEDVMALFR